MKCRGLDDAGRIDGGPMRGLEIGLRWVLIHLIEEYARHNGHATSFGNVLTGLPEPEFGTLI
ncbi:DUF664 domain-containing protein [Streptomyces sp. NPDC052773]|uniref:mycothiol transferase n=1 Tax=Streptomyces sp. NPDC052773 TaxID=3365693 RepID=UPI0037CECD88